MVIGYAPPGVDGKSAYVDVVRAANQMKEGGSYMAEDAQFGKYNDEDAGQESAAAAPAAGGGDVDPALLEEVNGFLTWIRDPNGLSGYIQYYLDQNDPTVLAKLAKAYTDFRSVFGF